MGTDAGGAGGGRVASSHETPGLPQAALGIEPILRRMDRYSRWQGAAGRTRRVPPRTRARAGRVRASSWQDGARRWFIALGTLALALALPHFLRG